MIFKAYIIEKMRFLIIIYYELGKNVADDLKIFWNRLAFFNPNLHEVYDLII